LIITPFILPLTEPTLHPVPRAQGRSTTVYPFLVPCIASDFIHLDRSVMGLSWGDLAPTPLVEQRAQDHFTAEPQNSRYVPHTTFSYQYTRYQVFNTLICPFVVIGTDELFLLDLPKNAKGRPLYCHF